MNPNKKLAWQIPWYVTFSGRLSPTSTEMAQVGCDVISIPANHEVIELGIIINAKLK
jgi:hypothetical protein